MAWGVDFTGGLSVQPDTAFALTGGAVAAQLCMVKPVELGTLDVQA